MGTPAPLLAKELIGMTTRVRSNSTAYSALNYVERHSMGYGRIWNLFGRAWTANYAEEARWASENIASGTHGRLREDLVLTPDMITTILISLSNMELFDGRKLNSTVRQRYALVLPGAKWNAMARRAVNTAKFLATKQGGFRNVTGLFGQRPRTDHEDGTVQTIYDSLDPWTQRHPWVTAQMELSNDAGVYEPWQGPFATEYELGILAFIVAFGGNIEIGKPIPCRPTPSVSEDIPVRTVARCELHPVGYTSIFTALNAPAVPRGFGADPRPTTTSTAHYMLDFFKPSIEPGDEIVVASIRVHWYRILSEITAITREQFPDVSIFGMAEPVEPDQQHKFFPQALGELVRILNQAAEEGASRLASTAQV